jgi:hypothetical protein
MRYSGRGGKQAEKFMTELHETMLALQARLKEGKIQGGRGEL